VGKPQRRTPVLLPDISEWEEEETIRSCLIQMGVTPQDLVHKGKMCISLRNNPGANGAQVSRLHLSYPLALTLTGMGRSQVGRCRIKLLEKKKERGHLAVECKGPVKPRLCSDVIPKAIWQVPALAPRSLRRSPRFQLRQ